MLMPGSLVLYSMVGDWSPLLKGIAKYAHPCSWVRVSERKVKRWDDFGGWESVKSPRSGFQVGIWRCWGEIGAVMQCDWVWGRRLYIQSCDYQVLSVQYVGGDEVSSIVIHHWPLVCCAVAWTRDSPLKAFSHVKGALRLSVSETRHWNCYNTKTTSLTRQI